MKLPLFAFAVCIHTLLCAQPNNPAPYCDGSFDDGADPGNSIPGVPVPDAILQVQLGTLNNNSNAQTGGGHYAYYSSVSAPVLYKGNTYTLSVSLDMQGGCGAAAWIDYNQNFVFDASEKIWFNNNLPVSTIQTYTAAVIIPPSAITGSTRFRVRLVEDDTYNGANNYMIQPCNASASPADVMDWGETEDYNVSISMLTGIAGAGEPEPYTLTLFPNPASGEIKVHAAAKNGHVEISDMSGKYVSDRELDPNGDARFDLTQLARGMYFVVLKDAKGRVQNTDKFIKE